MPRNQFSTRPVSWPSAFSKCLPWWSTSQRIPQGDQLHPNVPCLRWMPHVQNHTTKRDLNPSISVFALSSVTHSNQRLLQVSYAWDFRHRLVRNYWYKWINYLPTINKGFGNPQLCRNYMISYEELWWMKFLLPSVCCENGNCWHGHALQ